MAEPRSISPTLFRQETENRIFFILPLCQSFDWHLPCPNNYRNQGRLYGTRR